MFEVEALILLNYYKQIEIIAGLINKLLTYRAISAKPGTKTRFLWEMEYRVIKECGINTTNTNYLEQYKVNHIQVSNECIRSQYSTLTIILTITVSVFLGLLVCFLNLRLGCKLLRTRTDLHLFNRSLAVCFFILGLWWSINILYIDDTRQY